MQNHRLQKRKVESHVYAENHTLEIKRIPEKEC